MKKKYIIKLWLIFLILYLVYYMTILHPFPVYIYMCVYISEFHAFSPNQPLVFRSFIPIDSSLFSFWVKPFVLLKNL